MTGRLIFILIVIAASYGLGIIPGHKLGRRSRRHDYPKGWDAGQAAERKRWEDATGTTWDALAAWNAARPPDPDEEWEAWDHHGEAPSTEVLLTAANERLGKPRVPSVAEVDELATEYKRQTGWTPEEYARHNHSPNVPCVKLCPAFSSPPPAGRLGDEWDRIHPGWRQHTGRAPIVADLTGPAAWHYPGEDDVPTLTGLIVTKPQRDRTGPEWLECQIAAMDAETAAYLRRVEAEVASFRRGITTGART